MKRPAKRAAIVAAVVLMIVGILWQRSRSIEQFEQQDRQRRDEWIADTIHDLESGGNSVYFYSCINTNLLLERIAGMPQVEQVAFEQTIDLSDDGLRQLATLPNLRELEFRGESHLTDANVKLVVDCENLDSLTIVSCQVTDAALRDVAEMPNLQSFRHSGQFSAAALDELQANRPDCVLSETEWY